MEFLSGQSRKVRREGTINTIYHMPMPRSFAEVREWVAGARNQGARKIAHNTYAQRRLGMADNLATDSVQVTYHGNTIIEYQEDRILVAHCGWPTSTTADRFKHLTPFSADRKSTRFGGRIYGEDMETCRARAMAHNNTGRIFVAGIELPADGSAIALTWEGKPVVER